MSIGPPRTPSTAAGRPLANDVISPVCGSIRESRPALPSATYSAPPGPRALPVAPCRPEASSATSGAAGGVACATATISVTTDAATTFIHVWGKPIILSLGDLRSLMNARAAILRRRPCWKA